VSGEQFGTLALLLFVLVGLAHVLGYIFTRFHQPRVVGEITAGMIVGPALLGKFAPALSAAFSSHDGTGSSNQSQIVLGFLYHLGLLLLMFASGAETKGLFNRADRREVGWLGIVGTGVPFVLTLLAAPWIPVAPLIGPIGQRMPLLIVVSIAMAVTSIPVISKILYDLNILHTRFARLILGVAVLEDVVLWGVLAVATALAKSGAVPRRHIVVHVIATIVYFGLGLTVMPGLLKKISEARWNVLARTSPIGYVVIVLLAYAALAALFDVSLVFAAFLAGCAIVSRMDAFEEAVRAVSKVSFAFFIPIYFAVVGYQLDLSKSFSLLMLIVFLALGCVSKLLSAGLGARIAGFNWNDTINLSMALNARGGPGIVLASVAFDAGIINAAFYTTLVLFAALTSQVAGAWLDFVLRSGRPLLSGQVVETAGVAVEPAESILEG
jgi:Kef-type K+ transport system membrane component KefB